MKGGGKNFESLARINEISYFCDWKLMLNTAILMCRIKPYAKQMDEKQTSVMFRFDFYSMPSFRNLFVEEAKKLLPTQGFTERLLTEEEKQIINIDSVCSILDNSIEEVVSKKVYKLEVAPCQEEGKIDLYVGPYFLYVYCTRELNKGLPWSRLQEIFDLLAQYSRDIDLQNVACSVVFQATTNGEEMWRIFDHDAFPTLDVSTMTVGRYADSHQYEDITVELVRVVKIGVNELPDGTTIDPCYFVNITSISNLRDERLFEKSASGNSEETYGERIKGLYRKACEKATKCFNE